MHPDLQNLTEMVAKTLECDGSTEDRLSSCQTSNLKRSAPNTDNDFYDESFTLKASPCIPQHLHGSLLNALIFNSSRDVLDQFLAPIRHSLSTIDAASLLQLERLNTPVKGAARLDDSHYVMPIHTRVTPKCAKQETSTRYIHLMEVPHQYSMGIFVFPPGGKIPLHNHPQMCVLSRILYGDVYRISIDLVDDDDDEHENDHQNNSEDGDSDDDRSSYDYDNGSDSDDIDMSIDKHLEMSTNDQFNSQTASPLQASPTSKNIWSSIWDRLYQHKTVKATKPKLRQQSQKKKKQVLTGARHGYCYTEPDHLQAPQTTALYPIEGNIHEFVAGPQGAAILDILLPPYDDDRDCTFYQVVMLPLTISTRMAATSITPTTPTTTTTDDEQNIESNSNSNKRTKQPCLLLPIPQPEDFHCISGSYKGLGGSS